MNPLRKVDWSIENIFFLLGILAVLVLLIVFAWEMLLGLVGGFVVALVIVPNYPWLQFFKTKSTEEKIKETEAKLEKLRGR
jgi:uncharacterized membrane-anchored protein YitT (DUF2179 family)